MRKQTALPSEATKHALHCRELRYIVLSSLLVGTMVISVYPCKRRVERLPTTTGKLAYPETTREINLQNNLLVTSRYHKRNVSTWLRELRRKRRIWRNLCGTVRANGCPWLVETDARLLPLAQYHL